MAIKKGRTIIKILKFLLYFIIFTSILTLIIGIAGFISISSTFPDINPKNIDSLLDETSFIYDDSGNISEKIQSNIYRTIVPIEDIPANMQKAMVAIEDERFYQHNGVDIKRVFGALIHDIKSRSMEQGASTITMQLSKNLLTSSERSALRKFKDIVYAIELEKHLNKTQILYAYLNTSFFGSNVNGVQAAAKSYFNKNVRDINLAESAVIAGITQYPSKYIPYKLKAITLNDDFSKLQLKLYPPEKPYKPTQNDLDIYAKLRSIGKIDQYEYILLKNGSIVVTKAILNPDSIKRQRIILNKMLELGSIDKSQYSEALNTPIVISFPPRNNRGISSYFNDKVKKETLRLLIDSGNSKEKANDLLKSGGLKIYTTLNTPMQKILENEFSNYSNFPNSFTDKDGVIQPQGAMVVIEQKTGYVKALIGGRGQAGSLIYDRATNPRQPGSAIKPLAVYLLALKEGMTPSSIINDAPRKDPSSPTGYWPNNIYGKYYGDTTMKTLLEVSSNVAAVKTLESLGSTKLEAVNRSLDYLEQMGFSHLVRRSDDPVNNDENLSLALGGITKGVTPLEMASAYSGIANLGKQIKPTFIKKILDSRGNVLYEFKPSVFTMIDEINSYRMTDMLVGVIRSGSGRAAILNNMPSAGKTGTTDSRKDVYFAGYTPYYTASIWIGADTPVPLDYTSAVPANIWKNVMNKIDSSLNLPNKPFDAPPDVEPISTSYDAPKPEEKKPENTNQNNMIDGILFDNKDTQKPPSSQNEDNTNTDTTTEKPKTDDSTTTTTPSAPSTDNTTKPVETPPVMDKPKPEPVVNNDSNSPPPVIYEDTKKP